MPKPGTPLPTSIYDYALTVGFSRGFVVAAGIALLALLIAIATIRHVITTWEKRRDNARSSPDAV